MRYMVIGEAIVVPGGKVGTITTLPDDLSGLDAAVARAAHFNEQRPGEFEVAATFDLGAGIGIATRKGDEDMQRAIGEALRIFVEVGGYADLLEKYGLPAAVN